MIVVEDEDLFVSWIDLSADTRISGAQVAVSDKIRQSFFFDGERLAAPRPVLTVGRDHDPLFTQRMPAFFPSHSNLQENTLKLYPNAAFTATAVNRLNESLKRDAYVICFTHLDLPIFAEGPGSSAVFATNG
jgi:hypothetical protein